MTPDQAIALLTNFESIPPEQRQAVFNSIATAAPAWAKQAFSRDQKIVGLIQQLDKKLAACVTVIKSLGGTVPSVVTAEAPEEVQQAAPFVPSGKPRVNADGTPMSAEDAAIEDLMDAATAGMPPNPNAPAPVEVPLDPAVVASAEAGEPVVVPPPARPSKNGSAAAPKA